MLSIIRLFKNRWLRGLSHARRRALRLGMRAAADKQRTNGFKGDTWQRVSLEDLMYRLTMEVQELEEEIDAKDQNAEKIIAECGDVINFAVFIADNAKRRL